MRVTMTIVTWLDQTNGDLAFQKINREKARFLNKTFSFKNKMAHNRPPKKRQKKLDAAPSTAEVVDTSHQKVYIVLERACLETIKTKKVVSW